MLGTCSICPGHSRTHAAICLRHCNSTTQGRRLFCLPRCCLGYSELGRESASQRCFCSLESSQTGASASGWSADTAAGTTETSPCTYDLQTQGVGKHRGLEISCEPTRGCPPGAAGFADSETTLISWPHLPSLPTLAPPTPRCVAFPSPISLGRSPPQAAWPL